MLKNPPRLIKRGVDKLKNGLKYRHPIFLVRGKTKYFCIGRNKTGTTSISKAFEDLGFIVGSQTLAEMLPDQNYFSGVFDPIIEYCKSAQVFQDVPFSYPVTKFIFTVRNDADHWFQSITRFHANMFGNGLVPAADDLRNAKFVKKGFA